jgi:hypothetical protein
MQKDYNFIRWAVYLGYSILFVGVMYKLLKIAHIHGL